MGGLNRANALCVRPAPESETPKPSQKGGTCAEVTENLSQPTIKGCDWALTDEGKPGRSCKALRSGTKTVTRQVGMSSAFSLFYRVPESPEKRLRHSQVEAPVPWQVLLLKTRSYCVSQLAQNLLCASTGLELKICLPVASEYWDQRGCHRHHTA